MLRDFVAPEFSFGSMVPVHGYATMFRARRTSSPAAIWPRPATKTASSSRRVPNDAVIKTVVDPQARAVHLTLPSGVTRSAVVTGDQGCVTLPRGAKSAFFTPIKLRSVLPDPAVQPWPMGDQLPAAAPLPPEVAAEKVAEALQAAFDPPEALTAAFVVAYKGRIIAERYQAGLDHTTRLPGWSMGKSLTATLIGQLIHEGVYDLWAPAPVPAWQQPDDVRRTIRIADLVAAGLWRDVLAQPHAQLARARGCLLHGRCGRPVHDHHSHT